MRAKLWAKNLTQLPALDNIIANVILYHLSQREVDEKIAIINLVARLFIITTPNLDKSRFETLVNFIAESKRQPFEIITGIAYNSDAMKKKAEQAKEDEANKMELLSKVGAMGKKP